MDADFRLAVTSDKRRSESLVKIKSAARHLFIERGYHATKPQDISRAAGLGHGTFYLHFADKRACFLAFVEDSRSELGAHIQSRAAGSKTLEQSVSATLEAISEFAGAHPGVAHAALLDEAVIGASSLPSAPLVRQWGRDLARFIREGVRDGTMSDGCVPELLGQAIAGAVYQCWQEGERQGLPLRRVADELSRFVRRGVGS